VPLDPSLRVLLVEDVEDDAELMLHELRRAGVACASARVQSEAELTRALHAFTPDIVLSDHSLPQFTARDALRVVQRERPGTPVIIVTGSLDEETAAEYIKAGASDYIVKHRLHRLGPAVRRVMALCQAQREAADAAEARARSEQRFRKLVEFSSDVITLLDGGGAILYSSQSLNPTLGYGAGELTGHRVFELVHPDDRPLAERLFHQVAQNAGRTARADLRLRHKDGSWRDLEVVAVNHLGDPAVDAIVVNYRDVTERKRAEEQLRQTTTFLSHAQAFAHIGSWEWDIARDVITWSEETYRIFGLTPAAGPIALDQYLALIHPGDRDTVASAVREALERGASFEIDHRIVHPDGSVHFLHGRGGVVPGPAGGPTRMTGTVLDITARKQAEVALREANSYLHTLIESSPLAISSINPDGTVRTWNAAAEHLFGWSAAEVLGKPISIVSGQKLEECAALRQRVMGGESLSGVELVRSKKDGTLVTVNLCAAPLRDADGRVTGVLALIDDVTGVKRLEQQVFQAQKMEAVGRLAGGVAHDFNNLLTAILASTDLLLETLPADHPGREEAQETRKAALRAADLTRQLLAFSRQQVLAPRVLDLNEIVANLDKMLRRLIGDDVELRTALAPALGAVRADPGQLEQVIVNLAVNARDAMPTGGTLTIETANVALDESYAMTHTVVQAGPYVLLAVSDTGTGMDAGTKARMFEPFFTTKPKGKGTGLGLATVYGIVKQSGGYIWVYSEPGRGATFKIYLPRVDAPVQPTPPAVTTTGSLQGSETILVVEDQEEVRKLTRRVLEARGYRVLVAASGHEALRVAEQHEGPLHLLVTDVVMPGMSGREVGLLLAHARPGMKVLYLSGYTDESIVHHGVLAPGVAFLQKPFTAEVLARKVREVLESAT
jgi:two-component system, cell cycle sensor histidine kinase and response regulator CckA